jgi:DHA1 family bicyclomycin/chloramphenicol resistance-like MFS transporter
MEQQYRLTVKKPHTFSLILLTGFAAMSAVIVGPALPALVQTFNINIGSAQSVISIFLLGYALGQLIYGPIANRYGRIKALYFGISLTIAATFLCLLAKPLHNFTLLEIGRFIAAVGACSGLVVSYTIISDFYHTHQARSIYSYMTLAFAFIPGCGTLIGGFLVQFSGWLSCFYFLLGYSVLLLFLVTRLAETIDDVDHHALKPRKILHNYMTIFRNRFVMMNAIIYGMSTCCVYVFVAEAPFIATQFMGLSAAEYGSISMLPYLGVALGAITGPMWAKRINSQQVIKFGFMLQVICSLAMLILFHYRIINVVTLILPTAILMYAHAIIISNATNMAMGRVADRSNASAVFSFTFMMPAVLGTFSLRVIHTHQPEVMPLIFLVALSCYAICYYFGYIKKDSIRDAHTS